MYEESEDMHNCVFGYVNRCNTGNTIIFSVKADDTRVVTLEIAKYNKEYRIVQAREKYNKKVSNNETKNIIRIWADENNIKTINW